MSLSLLTFAPLSICTINTLANLVTFKVKVSQGHPSFLPFGKAASGRRATAPNFLTEGAENVPSKMKVRQILLPLQKSCFTSYQGQRYKTFYGRNWWMGRIS
jgi:hypothetical protein